MGLLWISVRTYSGRPLGSSSDCMSCSEGGTKKGCGIVRKHSFWPVPSYGLRDAHSSQLVKGGKSLDVGRLSLRDNTLPSRCSTCLRMGVRDSRISCRRARSRGEPAGAEPRRRARSRRRCSGRIARKRHHPARCGRRPRILARNRSEPSPFLQAWRARLLSPGRAYPGAARGGCVTRGMEFSEICRFGVFQSPAYVTR
jgi:hypothetical protein